jgi:hypothetical protein
MKKKSIWSFSIQGYSLTQQYGLIIWLFLSLYGQSSISRLVEITLSVSNGQGSIVLLRHPSSGSRLLC